MLTLGISTSSGQFALVMGENGTVIFNSEDYQLAENKDVDVLISACLGKTGKSPGDITNILVDIGPGGTSRVRTGIAFANSLSYSLGIPVCPVSSMELAGLDAWENYALPVIATVKSISGNAYIGFYNDHQLKGIRYGTIKEVVPELVSGLDGFAVVGYHREQIISLFPDKKVIDSGCLYGSVRILIEKIDLFKDRALIFPRIALPITEKTI